MPLGDLAKAAYGPDGKRKKRRRKRIRKEGHEEIDRAVAEERSRLARLWAEVSITEDAAAALVADPLTVAVVVEGAYAEVALATQKALAAGLGIGGDIALSDLSIAALRFDLTNPIAINWAANEAGSLIVEVSTEQVATVRSLISEGLTSGKGVRAVAPSIRDSIGLHSRYATAVERFRERQLSTLIAQHPRTPVDVLQRRANEKASKYADRLRRSRAKTIARTELQRAANEGQRQAWQQAVDAGELEVIGAEREYIATLGGHAICDDQDGIRIPWNGEFPVAGDPPIHPNCLFGDVRVAAEGVSATSKRWYEGDMIFIRVTSGQQLTCTPNHPILTTSGWVPAGALREGGYLVSSLRPEWSLLGDGNGENVPSPISEVVDAFRIASGLRATKVPVSAPDFHGDGAGSEVAVIHADGLLGNRRESDLDQQFTDRLFVGGQAPLMFDSHRPPYEYLDRNPGASNGGVGGGSLRLPRGRGLAGSDDAVGVTSRAQRQSGFYHEALDDVTSLAIPSAEQVDRIAGPIGVEQVIEIRRYPFAGQVYNLQTASSMYVASSILTHNCGCTFALRKATVVA